MGKVADRKRREFFAMIATKSEEELDAMERRKPYTRVKPRLRTTTAVGQKPEVELERVVIRCCMQREWLPEGFKPCHGCPALQV
jgi:hypothetical protein